MPQTRHSAAESAAENAVCEHYFEVSRRLTEDFVGSGAGGRGGRLAVLGRVGRVLVLEDEAGGRGGRNVSLGQNAARVQEVEVQVVRGSAGLVALRSPLEKRF